MISIHLRASAFICGSFSLCPVQRVQMDEAHVHDQALQIAGVSFTYPAVRREPARHALRDVSLSIRPGELVAMLGPNGSGKSTLMKIVCGLLPADSGSVAVFGETTLAAIRRMIGVVFQGDSLDGHMTVRENLRDQAALYGLKRDVARTRIEADLHEAGLTDRRGALVRTLSRGLSRRVDLCRTLLHRPPLLLLDEPTVGLDPTAREQFLSTIDRHRRERNLAVVTSTHLIDEADRADRVVLLHEGRLVAEGTAEALRAELGSRLLTALDPSWQPKPEHRAWRRSSGGYSLSLSDLEAASLTNELAARGIAYALAPPTLADVFEHHTGRSLAEQVVGSAT
jgi:ABC-2 type transport system ATP-binding protein